MKQLIVLLPLMFFVFEGCSTKPTQKLSTTIKYKKDIPVEVNGKYIRGMGVASPSSSYEIEIDYKFGKMDLLTFSTCHREIQLEGEGTKAKYIFKPTEIEIEGNCPLDIGIYDKKGRHGWGYLYFNNPKNSLIAKIQCNGEAYTATGVSACQSQIGTVQRITFETKVLYEVDTKGCELISKDQRTFEYVVVSDFCRFGFMDIAGNVHEHSTYGYETYIIRE